VTSSCKGRGRGEKVEKEMRFGGLFQMWTWIGFVGGDKAW